MIIARPVPPAVADAVRAGYPALGNVPVAVRSSATAEDLPDMSFAGAPLSHAAIVARELGIPAVVGRGNATMKLHSGDRILLDGERGFVGLLDKASG